MRMDGFSRLMWLRLIKGGISPGPNPDTDTSAADYNQLVDRVAALDAVLFIDGYDLLKVQTEQIAQTRVATQDIYVPISDYITLATRVSDIENLLTIPDGAIMQVKEDDEGDDITAQNIPYAKGEYVTKAEYDVLKNHVDDIENMLSGAAEKIFIALR